MFKGICALNRSYSVYSNPALSLMPMVRKKITIDTIRKLYKDKVPITMITAHDYPSSHFASESGIDITLIGDSLAMVALGFESTNQVTLEEMMHHSRAVKRGSKYPFLIGDMPFGTYESDIETAVKNAFRFVKEGLVEGVKLEGGVEMAPTIQKITSVGVPVLGHIGLTPQRASSLGGFKAQGKTLDSAKKLLEDAIALQKAGCFAIVLEAIPESVSTMITERIDVPTIGIGAGPHCSGQVLVQLDLLGVYDKLAPKFCKIYSNIGSVTMDALKRYGEEVKSGVFPESETHTYKMLKGQEELLKEWISKTKTVC